MRHVLIISVLFVVLTVAGAAFLITTPNVLAVSADLGLSELSQSRTGLPTQSPAEYTSTIIRWVLGIIGVLLVALIVYGGVIYATSAGNQEQVDTGKRILYYAIIGVVIVFAAFIISNFVISALVPENSSGSRSGSSGEDAFQQSIQDTRDFIGQPTSAPVGSGNDCFVNDSNQTCCRTSSGINYTCFNRVESNTARCYINGQKELCCPNVFDRIRCSD